MPISDTGWMVIATLVASVIAAVGSLVKGAHEWRREQRNREWLREDREFQRQMHTRIDDTQQQISDAATMSKAALAEANDVNHKIAEMGAALYEHPKLDAIETTVRDLSKRVPLTAIRSSDVTRIVVQREHPGERRHEREPTERRAGAERRNGAHERRQEPPHEG